MNFFLFLLHVLCSISVFSVFEFLHSVAGTGMCLEKVPPSSSSKYKQAEWDEQRVKCFELAGDLTLLYLQEQDKLQQQTTNTNTGTNETLILDVGNDYFFNDM